MRRRSSKWALWMAGMVSEDEVTPGKRGFVPQGRSRLFRPRALFLERLADAVHATQRAFGGGHARGGGLLGALIALVLDADRLGGPDRDCGRRRADHHVEIGREHV